MITLLQVRPYTGEDEVVEPSPNHGARRAAAIEGIVLHATADGGNEEGTLSWLRSPKSQASCHMLVGRSGRVARLVGDQQRAWHAGRSWWRGTSDVNSITLGIEIANRNDGEPYTDAQYSRVAEIVAHYCRQGLSLDDVVSHGEIAEDRRTDPLGWDWDRFRALVLEQLASGAALPPVAVVRTAEPNGTVEVAVQRRIAARPKPRAPSMTMPKQMPAAAKQRNPVVTTPKPVLRSRIVWLNGLTVLAAAGAIVAETLDFAFWVRLRLPEQVMVWALCGVALLNIVLRFRTTRPLGSTPGGTQVTR